MAALAALAVLATLADLADLAGLALATLVVLAVPALAALVALTVLAALAALVALAALAALAALTVVIVLIALAVLTSRLRDQAHFQTHTRPVLTLGKSFDELVIEVVIAACGSCPLCSLIHFSKRIRLILCMYMHGSTLVSYI